MAGWRSPVSRLANAPLLWAEHTQKISGSNPLPATMPTRLLRNFMQDPTVDPSAQNYEDSKILKCLDEFATEHGVDTRELFKNITESIGYCHNCTAYNKSTSFCSFLKVNMGVDDRCSEFEAIEEETESPFEVMMEPFKMEEEYKRDAVKFNKYTKWSKHPQKNQGPSSNKEASESS